MAIPRDGRRGEGEGEADAPTRWPWPKPHGSTGLMEKRGIRSDAVCSVKRPISLVDYFHANAIAPGPLKRLRPQHVTSKKRIISPFRENPGLPPCVQRQN